LGIPGEGTPVERLKKLRPSAVRAFPEEQKFRFDTFYAEDILQVCQQLHLPVILTQTYDQLFLTGLPQVCEQYPEVPIILPRFGMNKCHCAFPILKKLHNVYLDMSTMADVAVIEEITERFGSTNLLFGSGLPTYEPSGALGLLYYAGISQKDRENIAFRNFERLEGGIRYDD
jgi:predicted TIM-barrel fold metal-dependent hydrolase